MSEQPELQYGNARCGNGHPLWVVTEGYAYCHATIGYWFAWRFTQPLSNHWRRFPLEDGTEAWVQIGSATSKAEMLAFIEADIEAHREAPALAEGPTYAEYLAAVAGA